MYPFVNPIAQDIVRPYRCLRHRATVVNNETVKGLVQIGTFSGAITERAVQIGTVAGGTGLEDVTHELFFDRGARAIDEADEILEPTQGVRYRVLRVFRYPSKTVLWVTRSTTAGATK